MFLPLSIYVYIANYPNNWWVDLQWLSKLSGTKIPTHAAPARWGKYASDAYEIFVLKQISTVQPTDVYLRWQLGGKRILPMSEMGRG